MKFLKRNWVEVKPETDIPWWSNVRTITVTSLMWLFSNCDTIPTDEIILDSNNWSEKFSVEYHHSGWWNGEPIIFNYNVSVTKNKEKYKWIIEQKDWLFKNVTEIESNNVDRLFDEIANKLDHDFITEDVRNKKDKKVAFAKKAYKNNVINNKEHNKWETRIKYKK